MGALERTGYILLNLEEVKFIVEANQKLLQKKVVSNFLL